MTDRLARWVGQQVLLGNVGNIFGLGVFGEQVIKRLVLVRAHLGGNRLIPFFGVVELRIDVEHDTAKRKYAVPHHLADLELGVACLAHARTEIILDWEPPQGLKVCTERLSPGPWSRPGGQGRAALWPVSTWHRPASCRRSSPRRCRRAWHRRFFWRRQPPPDRARRRAWRSAPGSGAASRRRDIP